MEAKVEFNAKTTVKELFETTLEIFTHTNETLGTFSSVKHSLTLYLKNDPDHVVEISCLKRELTKSEKEEKENEE